MVLLSLMFSLLGSKTGFEHGFNLGRIVPGNWSRICSAEQRKIVMYFVVVGPKHYQALLDDKFFNIKTINSTSCNVEWNSNEFNLTFANHSLSHYYAFHDIENTNLSLQVEFFNPHTVGILFIDKVQRKFHSYFFTKSIMPSISVSDIVKVVSFSFLVIYLTKQLINSIRQRLK